MGMIDRAKVIQRHITDVTTPHRVVFHHMPKCGGTSVSRAIRKRYLVSQSSILVPEAYKGIKALHPEYEHKVLREQLEDFNRKYFLYLLYQDVRCIAAHVTFSENAYNLFKEKYKFVTVLREPVSRFISHYFYNAARPQGFDHITDSFEDFLKSERARQMGASYAIFYGDLSEKDDPTSDAAVQRAQDNLKLFDVVGLLNDLESFEAGLKRELGVTFKIGHDNKMRQPNSAKREVVTPELKQKVIELCAPDLAIWRSVGGADPSKT
jgi:hypothetical protein